MLKIGVQTQNVVNDDTPDMGYRLLKDTGFDCCDFSLNTYLINLDIYKFDINNFFDMPDTELEVFFLKHRDAAEKAGISINQMHMPYPIVNPYAPKNINDYMVNVVAPKSMEICSFLGCPNIVVHGFKMKNILGSEEREWAETEKFLNTIAPLAKKNGTVICVENIYESVGGHIVEGPCCDARKAADRIDRINEKFDAEVLGFCYDVGHANLIGLDHYDFLTTLGNRMKVLHIHDNDGVGDLHQIPFTFTRVRENTSSTDWDGFIAGLKKIGFDGVLSFETAPVLKSFPSDMKEDALAFIAKIGRYFGRKICDEI